MRFSYQIGMCEADHYVPLAKAAEQAGYDGLTIPDSICYPQEASSKYPYNKDGSREFLESVPFLESLIAVAGMATVTEKIRFATFVYKVAVRQAAIVAKQVQSIQALSNNRFDFGVGISPWEEDFAVCDVPWEKRGLRLDEQIDIIRGLESGEFFGYKGEIHNMPAIKMTPKPTAPTPILVGGHAEPALRRAARLGDGWISAGSSLNELRDMIGQIEDFRKDYGRDQGAFEYHAMTEAAYSAEGLTDLANAGVTEVIIAFRNPYDAEPDTQTVEEKVGMINWYAENVIKPYRGA